MKVKFLAYLIIFVSGLTKLIAQPAIDGPACVVPGVVYQYNIHAVWDSAQPVQLCIHGGTLADFPDSCASNVALPSIKIIWTDSVAGMISLNLPTGDTSFNVSVTSLLLAGMIDSLSEIQIIDSLTIPTPISSTGASGGGCIPSYQYQWQQSENNVDWDDLLNSQGASLTFSAALTHTAYFRRRVTDLNSGTIAYSTIASIFIGIPNQ